MTDLIQSIYRCNSYSIQVGIIIIQCKLTTEHFIYRGTIDYRVIYRGTKVMQLHATSSSQAPLRFTFDTSVPNWPKGCCSFAHLDSFILHAACASTLSQKANGAVREQPFSVSVYSAYLRSQSSQFFSAYITQDWEVGARLGLA